MSNVVQFLEALARNPKTLTAEELAIVVTSASRDSAVQQALLSGDTFALSEALGGRARMICMVAPAENDEPLEDDHQDDEDDSTEQEKPSQAA